MSGYEIPTTEPVSIVAGDTVKWTKSVSGYLPADGWVLTYAFVKAGVRVQITAADNGDGTFLATFSSANTTALGSGSIGWQAYVTKSGERHTVGAGTLDVTTDFATQASGYDARTSNQKILDALIARCEGRATREQSAMSIAGRSISLLTPDELSREVQRYEARVARERRRRRLANGLPPGRQVRVRF